MYRKNWRSLMGRVIIVASGKGGAGKTTVSALLARAIARQGESVVVVDGDMGMSNLDSQMGVESKVVFDLSDLLLSKCRIKQALIQDVEQENLYVLASSKGDGALSLDCVEKFCYIIKKLSEVFDYCLIDAPAGSGEGFKVCLAAANEAIVVVTPHISSIRDADKIISATGASLASKTMVVINRIRGDLVIGGTMLSEREIMDVLPGKLVGIVPEYDVFNIYPNVGHGCRLDDAVKMCFDMLACSIIFGKVQLFDYKKKYRGLSGFIKRKIVHKII